MLLHEQLELNAREVPQKTAMVSETGRMTYAEFENRSSRIANMLVSAGVAKGDPVAILLPPTIDWPVAYFAAVKVGARAVVVNAMLKPAEVFAQLAECQARAVITDGRFAAGMRQMAPAGAPLPYLLQVEEPEFEAAFAAASGTRPDIAMSPDDECTIMYTSGVLEIGRASCRERVFRAV
jgi:acyl-CoA synthetase (AMP-forming)/AMP-acid ligase II